MTSNQAVCNRIADLCKEQVITYYTLAWRAAIPQSTLKNIFRKCKIRLDTTHCSALKYNHQNTLKEITEVSRWIN